MVIGYGGFASKLVDLGSIPSLSQTKILSELMLHFTAASLLDFNIKGIV